MSLFTDIFRPKQKDEQQAVVSQLFKTLTPYRPAFHNWQGSIYESELIRAAINARARHISKLKFDVTGSAKVGKTRPKPMADMATVFGKNVNNP